VIGKGQRHLHSPKRVKPLTLNASDVVPGSDQPSCRSPAGNYKYPKGRRVAVHLPRFLFFDKISRVARDSTGSVSRNTKGSPSPV